MFPKIKQMVGKVTRTDHFNHGTHESRQEEVPTSTFNSDEWDKLGEQQEAERRRVEAKRATPEYKAEEAKRQAGKDFEATHGVPSTWKPNISRIAPAGRSQSVHDQLIEDGHRRETNGLISVAGQDYSADSYSIKHALTMFGNSQVSVHPHGAGERAKHVLTNVRTENDHLIGTVGSAGDIKIPLSEISSLHYAGYNPEPSPRVTNEHEIWRQ
jgi:hypothetical protein